MEVLQEQAENCFMVWQEYSQSQSKEHSEKALKDSSKELEKVF